MLHEEEGEKALSKEKGGGVFETVQYLARSVEIDAAEQREKNCFENGERNKSEQP